MQAYRAISYWRSAPLLILLCLALTACAAQASAHATPSATPSATSSAQDVGKAPGPTATPNTTPPYAFPDVWHAVPSLAPLNSSAYAFAPSDGRIGYLCERDTGSIYSTHDGGDTWHVWAINAFSSCQSVFIDAHDASDIFVVSPVHIGLSTRNDLWRSRDGGVIWHRLGGIMGTGSELNWGQVAVVGSRLIAQAGIVGEGYQQDDLYYSDDGGMTWRPWRRMSQTRAIPSMTSPSSTPRSGSSA